MKDMRHSTRYFLVVSLFMLFGLWQDATAQAGCTYGWSANPSENAPALNTVALPSALGSGSVPYMDIIISIETGCQERLEFNNIGFTEPGCSIIEYFNQSGQFVGVEDLEDPSSSTVIFNGTDIDGVGGFGGSPSGVANGTACLPGDNVTIMFDDGYSPDYMCDYTPAVGCTVFPGAEAGQFYFFRSVEDPLVQNTNMAGDGYHFNAAGLNKQPTYRAVRIVSVRESAAPVIMGPFGSDVCDASPIILDNGPTDLIGDPRKQLASNSTDVSTTITLAEITANNPTRDTAAATLGKIRALYCTESTDPYQGGPGSTTNLLLTGPGTGYLDGDADGNGIGDIPNITDPNNNMMQTTNTIVFNDFYDNFTGVIAGPGSSASAMGSGNTNTVYNYNTNPDFNDTPDPCGGIVVTSFVDFPSIAKRGDLYGSLAEDYATADGRIRICREIRRQWTATDANGNSSVWNQRIDVVDDYVRDTLSMFPVSEAGSPYFKPVTTVTGSISTIIPVSPAPTTVLDTTVDNGSMNIYVDGGFLTTPNYTSTISGFTRIESSFDTTYAFPAFVYAPSPELFNCNELTTLDGFTPMSMDNCGIRATLNIDDLVDYGGDGDFGDEDVTSPIYYYNNSIATPAYVQPGMTLMASGLDDEDDDPLDYDPFDFEFYNYTVLRRWVVEDNCGFRSIAQRIYNIKDDQAPAISSALVSINGGGTLSYTPQLMAETAATLNSPNIRTYMIPGVITVVDPDCSPELDIVATFLDNCAANPFVSISYEVTQVNNFGNTVGVSSGSLFGTNTAIPLPVGGTYTVTLMYTDPTGNISNLNVQVTTSETDEPLNVNTLLSSSIGLSGIGTVDYLDIAEKDDIEEFLSNLCTVPNCIELVIKGTDANGNVIEDRGIYEVELPNIQLAGLANSNDPSLTFNCADIGAVKQVSVEIHRVTNCNFTTIPVTSTLASTTTLLDTRTSTVSILGPSAPFTVSTTGQAASSAIANDGVINVNVTPNVGTPTQNYTITYTGPVNGSVVSNTNPTVISGLPQGTYTVVVVGSTSCGSQSSTITLGTSTPANVMLNCPITVGNGSSSFTLRAGTGFTNITSMTLQLVLTGPAGTDIPSASLTSIFATSVSSAGGLLGFNEDPNLTNTYNVLLSVPLGSGVSAASGDPLISFQLDVPATAVTGNVIEVTVTGSAQQNPGFGSATNNIPFNGSVCSMTVSSSPSGTLSAAGSITYLYCNAPVQNVGVTLQSVNPNQVKFADAAGAYNFSANIPAGSAITITPDLTSFQPSFTTYMLDGGDLSALLSLLLGTTPLSPYQLIAADINQDGFLDGADAILLLNNINTSNSAFLNSWIFMNANATVNSFVPTVPNAANTSFTTSSYAATNSNINFIGIKPGDVLPDCSTGSGVVIRGVAVMNAKDQAIKRGESYELTFNLKDIDGLNAFQTVLNFNPAIVKPTEMIVSDKLKATGLTDARIEDAAIRILGAAGAAVELSDEDALLTLRFEALKDISSLRSVFNVSQDNPSLLFDGNNDRNDLVLMFDQGDVNASTLQVYGSAPNPFSTNTNIQFNLSQNDQVQLVVTDVTGRVLYRNTSNYDAGYNQIELTADKFNAAGILIYTLSTSDTKHTGKLLLVK